LGVRHVLTPPLDRQDAPPALNDTTRPFSSPLVDGPDRAPSRAMLYAVGFKKDDFTKPQIGIASTWSQVTPCNVHIDHPLFPPPLVLP
jgi:dihydroxyacid dehydratase/phosphogluconate dehydratase